MPRFFIFCLIGSLLLPPVAALAQTAPPFARWTATTLTLDNGVVRRIIQLPPTAGEGNFLTIFYQPVRGEFQYFRQQNDDFQFELNDSIYAGAGCWQLVNIAPLTDAHQGNGAAVTLRSHNGKAGLTVKFLLYPALPVVRKSLVVTNLTPQPVRLESVDVEKLAVTEYFPTTFSWVCADYGRRRSIGPYEGTMQDALLTVHNPDWRQGIVVGNEAAGVMKRTAVFWDTPGTNAAICAGLTHKTARFPFRQWLNANESFETPQVFTMVYNDCADPDEMLNTAVPDFVRKHMGIRLSAFPEKPTFVYNTWQPFEKNINEKLIRELAAAAAKAGMKEFVIDDGWQDRYGDWGVDKQKFPRGLKPVFDYIKSLGMKPGLWVSIGTAAPGSQVYRAHPEWFVQDKRGQPTSLVIADPDKYTACFGTGWQGYIQGVLAGLVADYGLEYLKLDFSVVTSPYRFDPAASGCYATDHAGHRDQRESLYTNYEPMWQLFDALHAAQPKLFIDCTFETMGGLQLIDYAMLKHAEGNWLSNFDAPNELTDLRVRQMAWWRAPAMPAAALVLGNPAMQDAGGELHLKSLAGALPIMLGDPRQLAAPALRRYRQLADWLQAMQQTHDFMSFRQDLAGYGEPKTGSWDGFQRINTDTRRGGIVGVFRHGSPETTRTVTVRYLDPARRYRVLATDGKTVATLTGAALQTTGFPVTLAALYAGELYEVRAE